MQVSKSIHNPSGRLPDPAKIETILKISRTERAQHRVFANEGPVEVYLLAQKHKRLNKDRKQPKPQQMDRSCSNQTIQIPLSAPPIVDTHLHTLQNDTVNGIIFAKSDIDPVPRTDSDDDKDPEM